MSVLGNIAAGAAVVVLCAQTARADVIFRLGEVGRTTVGFAGSVVITDDAYRSGYSVYLHTDPGPPGWAQLVSSGTEAVRSINFDFTPSYPDVFTLADFSRTGRYQGATIMLSAAPYALPNGSFRYFDDSTEFSYTLSGATGMGDFRADYYYIPCDATYGANSRCRFSTVTSVPEPAGLAVLGTGVAVLAWVRRRRRGIAVAT